MLQAAGLTPGSPWAITFQHRVLHSNEVYATFGLANSLAGFLVGPLVLMLATLWEGLVHRDAQGRRAGRGQSSSPRSLRPPS